MKRFATAFVVLAGIATLGGAACSGKSKTSTTGAGSGSDSPVLAKKIHLAWGIQQGASSAEMYLQTTDETGRQVSHPLGTFPGTCSANTPAPEMKAIIGALCKQGGTGTELHAVVQGAEVIVLKMRADEGVPADPMAREEVTRIRLPSDAAVDAG